MQLLLFSRKLGPLFATQFGGAFNDNLYKNAFAVLLVYSLAEQHNYNTPFLVNLTQAIFIVPYLLFGTYAGALGDIYDKARLIQYTKLMEILVVLMAMMAFYVQNIPLLIFVVFLFSLQSTFFGPLKYSIIPYHLPNKLVDANALMNAGTFIAIIGGTLLGAYLVSLSSSWYLVSFLLVVVALGGYLTSRFIPKAPPVNKQVAFPREPFSAAFQLVRVMLFFRQGLKAPLLGVAWFWFAGASVITQIPILTGDYLAIEPIAVSLFMIMFACGIGIGALLCVLLLEGKPTSRFAWGSSMLMGILLLDTGLAAQGVFNSMNSMNSMNMHTISRGEDYIAIGLFLNNWHAIRLCIDFSLLSTAAGFYVVPLFALLQQRAPAKERARVIAANNILNAVFMVVSALLIMLAYSLKAEVFHIFIILGGCCLLVAIQWFRVQRSPS